MYQPQVDNKLNNQCNVMFEIQYNEGVSLINVVIACGRVLIAIESYRRLEGVTDVEIGLLNTIHNEEHLS